MVTEIATNELEDMQALADATLLHSSRVCESTSVSKDLAGFLELATVTFGERKDHHLEAVSH